MLRYYSNRTAIHRLITRTTKYAHETNNNESAGTKFVRLDLDTTETEGLRLMFAETVPIVL